MVFCNKTDIIIVYDTDTCHNPYFNRWFSAINGKISFDDIKRSVTILILIDGFLQFRYERFY